MPSLALLNGSTKVGHDRNRQKMALQTVPVVFSVLFECLEYLIETLQ